MNVELIKIFLNQYRTYNERELNRINNEQEATLVWGIIHCINSIESFISTMEDKEK